MTQRWYVVQSRPSQEIRAWVAVTDLGFPTFFPQYSVRVKRPEKGFSPFALRPLFPSYLFVQFDVDPAADEDWGDILRARGVFTLLGMRRSTNWNAAEGAPAAEWAGAPVPMPHKIVPELLAWRDTARQLIEPKTRVRLRAGQRVRVAYFDRDLDALVQVDKGRRVRVLLDMLGRSVPTMVDRDSVELR